MKPGRELRIHSRVIPKIPQSQLHDVHARNLPEASPALHLISVFLLFLLCIPIFAAARPNIIFILADDLGCGDLSCYGGETPTPYLDRLAREGTRFTQAYSAAPICSPSRAGLITGQHPARWRITSFLQTRKGNRACEQDDFLDPAAPSLPRTLKAAGYRTAHIGKWHLGGGRDVTNAPPFSAYGYDAAFGTYEGPEPHPEITATNWIWSPHDPVKRIFCVTLKANRPSSIFGSMIRTRPGCRRKPPHPNRRAPASEKLICVRYSSRWIAKSAALSKAFREPEFTPTRW
jgi:hypothetical protein